MVSFGRFALSLLQCESTRLFCDVVRFRLTPPLLTIARDAPIRRVATSQASARSAPRAASPIRRVVLRRRASLRYIFRQASAYASAHCCNKQNQSSLLCICQAVIYQAPQYPWHTLMRIETQKPVKRPPIHHLKRHLKNRCLAYNGHYRHFPSYK